jgi:PAS domain S-box-containing protein
MSETAVDLNVLMEQVRSLRVEVATLRAAVDNAPALVYFQSADGIIRKVNRPAAAFLGHKPEEIVGLSLHDLWPEEAERFMEAARAVIREGKPSYGVLERNAKSAPGRWYRVDRVPWRKPNGTIQGVIVFATDVTDYVHHRELLVEMNQRLTRHKAEVERAYEELEQKNLELSRANAELDEFTAIAGHDLKAPLREITTFVTLLEKDLGDHLPRRAAEDLQFVHESAQKMRTLIDDLLSLSRTSRAEIDRAELPLEECVNSALGFLSVSIRESMATIERDEMPTVLGDRTLLTELFQNLVDNALKFSGPGAPRIRLTAELGDEGWVFGVRDEGVGIAPEYFERVFSPFQRLHGQSEVPGSGMGLAICRKVVERHAGRLWLESVPSEWTHFQFTLGGE